MKRIVFVRNGGEIKEHEVDFLSTFFEGECRIKYSDERRIPLIAEEFDGIETIRYFNGDPESVTDISGYTRLKSIITGSDGSLQIILIKE